VEIDSVCETMDGSLLMKFLVLGAEAEVLKKEKQRDISSSSLKSSKKKHSEKWVRDSKHSFSHPWLLTSLKGHSGEVLDMDFSSNGKFLATCAEGKKLYHKSSVWLTKFK
jgi:WD domain, G-beta repeat.